MSFTRIIHIVAIRFLTAFLVTKIVTNQSLPQVSIYEFRRLLGNILVLSNVMEYIFELKLVARDIIVRLFVE